MTQNSAVIYRGLSLLDPNSRVAVVVTGLSDRSQNPKTGGMVQTYILRDDRRPYAAILDGSDAAICGACPHRRNAEGLRSCYVNPATGLNTVGRQLLSGAYPDVALNEVARACAGRAVRVGTYGDPAAVPAQIWRDLTALASSHTGYTHQWRYPWAQAYKGFLMASCDSDADRDVAKAAGWRTFRVRKVTPKGVEPLSAGEIVCPAGAEGGHKTTCERCGLCAGAARVAKDIAIIDHSTSARAKVRKLNVIQ